MIHLLMNVLYLLMIKLTFIITGNHTVMDAIIIIEAIITTIRVHIIIELFIMLYMLVIT